MSRFHDKYSSRRSAHDSKWNVSLLLFTRAVNFFSWLFYHTIAYEIRQGTLEQTESEREWVLAHYSRTAKKRSVLSGPAPAASESRANKRVKRWHYHYRYYVLCRNIPWWYRVLGGLDVYQGLECNRAQIYLAISAEINVRVASRVESTSLYNIHREPCLFWNAVWMFRGYIGIEQFSDK